MDALQPRAPDVTSRDARETRVLLLRCVGELCLGGAATGGGLASLPHGAGCRLAYPVKHPP